MRRQPRRDFDDERLAELAQSIEQSGVLQPVVVRQRGRDYELIAGERRWRAARIAGLTELPAVVKETSDADAFALALVENLQREDLSPLEMAEALKRLTDEHNYTQEQLAQRLGKSRSAIANTLRLLKLGDDAQDALAAGQLSEGHARQLIGLEPEAQAALLDEVVEEQLSVRQTEARARDLKPQRNTPAPQKKAPSKTRVSQAQAVPENLETRALLERLELALGTRVTLVDNGRGHGHIAIHFDSYEILEGLEEHLLGSR